MIKFGIQLMVVVHHVILCLKFKGEITCLSYNP